MNEGKIKAIKYSLIWPLFPVQVESNSKAWNINKKIQKVKNFLIYCLSTTLVMWYSNGYFTITSTAGASITRSKLYMINI
jgi:hypothetical protein